MHARSPLDDYTFELFLTIAIPMYVYTLYGEVDGLPLRVGPEVRVGRLDLWKPSLPLAYCLRVPYTHTHTHTHTHKQSQTPRTLAVRVIGGKGSMLCTSMETMRRIPFSLVSETT